MKSVRLQVDTVGSAADATRAQGSLLIAGVALTLITGIALFHPHPVVLPLLSVILVVAALLVAGFVALRTARQGGPMVERLHLAGLIMFYGFACSMLGDIDPAVKSIEALRR